MNGLNSKISVAPHSRIKNTMIKQITITKENRKRMKTDTLKKIAEGLLKKEKNKNARLMIKVLSDEGYFTLKHYDQSIDEILNEQQYLNSRENKNMPQIYKATFYIQYKKK